MRRTFKVRRFLAGIAVLSVGLLMSARAPADTAGIELRAKMVVGNELRLVVETYRSVMPFYAHSSKTLDAKGYVIFIDMASEKPLKERARVFGPLWDVPDSRSSISFMDGVHFTDKDRKAARVSPHCVFDTNGDLVRFIRDKRDILMRDVFVPDAKAGTWQHQGEVKSMTNSFPPGSEDRLVSFSRRFALYSAGAKAQLFDLFTGEQKEDAWLTRAFADARSIKDLNNVRFFLTDDLNHLVVSPMAIWNTGLGPEQRIIEDFELNGKTYKRSDVGLAYSRSDSAPTLFSRTMTEKGFLDEGPHGAFSIEGRLFLFMNDEKSLRLYTPDGKKEFRLTSDGKPVWPIYPFLQMQHDPARDKLFIFDTSVLEGKMGLNLIVRVFEWNYKAGNIVRHDVPIGELFKESWGKLQPRSVIGVK